MVFGLEGEDMCRGLIFGFCFVWGLRFLRLILGLVFVPRR